MQLSFTDSNSLLTAGSLTFWDSSPGFGPLVANVYSNLTGTAIDPPNEVPLPATLPLFAAGLGMLGLLLRRKR
jgi:hypothetical protein